MGEFSLLVDFIGTNLMVALQSMIGLRIFACGY
jgi:hypothetical protein